MLSAAKAAAAGISGAQSLTVLDLTRTEPPVIHPVLLSPADATKQAKVDIARRAEASAWSQGDAVAQVLGRTPTSPSGCSSPIPSATSRTPTPVRTRLAAQVVASRGDLTQTGFDGPGASQGHGGTTTSSPPRASASGQPSRPCACSTPSRRPPAR